MSLEDDILGILNTSSDPESEWEISKELQTIKISKSLNTQLEVD